MNLLKTFALLAIVLSGCQDVKYPEKPDNLIPKEKMVDILTETYLANAARSVERRSIDSKGIKLDSMIYKNFGIDSIQFAKSNAYYATDINAYMEIFTEVTHRLTLIEKKVDSILESQLRQSEVGKEEKVNEEIPAEPVRDSLI